MTDRSPGFATLAIHAGAQPDPTTGARATPIYQTTSFVFESVDHAASLFGLQTFGNIYTRIGNPTNAVLEERVAALEGGTAGLAVASGHAAQVIVMHCLMQPGEEFVASKKLYGGTFNWSREGRYPMLSEPRPEYHGIVLHETFGNFAFAIACRVLALRDIGPALSPFNAFLILTGIETLPLRMQRACDNALAVAHWLARHPKVAWVSYPGLPGDRYHNLAKKYVPNGAGAVFTFGLRGGYDAGVKLVSNVRMFSHLANIGDTRSLIIHPASTTHRQLSDEQKVQAGAGPDVVRLSIGLEDKEDIIADLDQALEAA